MAFQYFHHPAGRQGEREVVKGMTSRKDCRNRLTESFLGIQRNMIIFSRPIVSLLCIYYALD